MNAYEFAEMMIVHDGSQLWQHAEAIANMLRQQADRIEKLESYLKASQESRIEDGKYQADRIAELEKVIQDGIKVFGEIQNQRLKDKFETPQTKPLSDEEIEEVIRKHWNKEYKNRGMMAFARAIEERHGIK